MERALAIAGGVVWLMVFLLLGIAELEGAVERASDNYAEKPAETADREPPQEQDQ